MHVTCKKATCMARYALSFYSFPAPIHYSFSFGSIIQSLDNTSIYTLIYYGTVTCITCGSFCVVKSDTINAPSLLFHPFHIISHRKDLAM